MFQNLIDILTSPNAAIKRLQENPTVLFPLLLLMAAMASMQVGYIMLSDFGYMIDQMVDQAMAVNPNLRENDARALYENLSPTVLAISGGVGTPVFILIIYALYAAYLNFVSKFGKQEYSFKHWFSLICWTSMPTLLVVIAAWVVILTSATGQISQSDLQPLSIDSLLALNSGSALMQNLSLPQFWALGLLVLGYRHFTGKSIVTSALVALAPYILMYGIWVLITLL